MGDLPCELSRRCEMRNARECAALNNRCGMPETGAPECLADPHPRSPSKKPGAPYRHLPLVEARMRQIEFPRWR